MHILRYLKSTPWKGLQCQDHDHLEVKENTDADQAGLVMVRKSTSGYCMYVDNILVSWKSKKHHTISTSSVEDECRATEQHVNWSG